MADRSAVPPRAADPLRLPPQNVEAEEALLSAILGDNTALLDVVDLLGPADFYRTAHRAIFAAMIDLFNRGEPIDLVTVTNALKEKGRLEEIGGASFVARLLDEVLPAANAQHYARIVHDKAVLRRLIEQANAIAKRCYEEQGPAEEIIDFAEAAIFEVTEKKARQAFYPLSKLIDRSIDFLEEKQKNKSLVTGVPTGFLEIDRLTSGLQNADLIILAARPSMGKTALALNIARNAAVDAGIPVAIFSLEMSKEQITLRLLCAEARIDSSKLRSGFLTAEDWERVTDAASTLQSAPIFIDDSPGLTALEVRAKARRLKMDKNIGLIVIDYLQLMQGRPNAERRELEISEISRALKSLAKELDLPVLALSQLNRMLEQRTDKRPRLSDLRESGALEQDADVVAFIYRDEVYNPEDTNPNRGTAEILLAKQRNGPTGDVRLTFLSACTRFENMAAEAMRP
ncbi:MAG: replicative DNA helicase [Desulfobacterales bacterium]